MSSSLHAYFVSLEGVAPLFDVAKNINPCPTKTDSEIFRISKVVEQALAWMAVTLKVPSEKEHHHFGKVLAVANYSISFSVAIDGSVKLVPILHKGEPYAYDGWVRGVNLGSELFGYDDFPTCLPGEKSWTDGLYLKLVDEPIQTEIEARFVSGTYIPIPACELFNPRISTS